MYHRYSTALSHLFLAGIGIYCFKTSTQIGPNNTTNLPLASYGIIVANSILGVWKWGNPAHGHRVERVYSYSRLLQTLFAFPCIVTQLWLNHGYPKELAYLHPTLSLVPLFLYLSRKHRLEFVDFMVALDVLSCAVVSFSVANWFGVASAVSYTINHFVLREESEVLDMPSIDFYNYALCFFSYFSLRALQGAA